jgi:ribosome recycling factor
VQSTREALAALRTGRADPALLDRIRVRAYDGELPMAHVATVGVPDARSHVVTPFDPGLLAAIERAITASDLGLNPSNDGQRLRLSLPPPSAEQRADLAKRAKAIAEAGRVAVRNARRDAINQLKRDCAAGHISEAKKNGRTKDMQALTDEHVAQVDALLAAKLADLAS